MTTPWPPGGEDLNLDKARGIIPISIYKFLAWVIGSSNDPQEERLVTVSESDDQRIVSIAQDIIYHASSERKQMPKHLALGMTVRHMTGSAKLIGILNGFGHALSHSAVFEHDTAIAEQQTKKVPLNLPPFIEEGRFTTLVWDNNDFGEETITGNGTTHNRNVIVIPPSQGLFKPTSRNQENEEKVDTPQEHCYLPKCSTERPSGICKRYFPDGECGHAVKSSPGKHSQKQEVLILQVGQDLTHSCVR
ncbi:hypothetical protein BSL78_17397 [Apostichopus japonicus]|uniref:Uncharacterized protein n=1 Tax=Stichopus japonicus TaxID=307972 RepID=A0A2G8KCM6_STIJA|nr:hypothetical protein BSL78_17397 [Apostichopus japonicus]